ncbi:MAG TPA: 2-iminoacetate synthase ThiH [Elusimicrobiales bacterium]|nr:2-iminoacetate synthase ThiH [Elusimicrobiales bacterium]
MSFFNTLSKLSKLDFGNFSKGISEQNVLNAIEYTNLSYTQFLTLLSLPAQKYLEPMAQKANGLTLQNFGKVIGLYTPIYLSNYCENKCLYCGFNADNKIKRKKLSLKELEQEAKLISKTQLHSVIILTGDSRNITPVKYIADSITVLNKHFSSVSIEVYALSQKEYANLITAGLDGVAIYQETYNQKLYKKLHPVGPKKDFYFRLDAPERACKEKIRNVSVGALLGLDDWRRDIFFTAMHAKYLQDNYPETDISISLPRLCPHEGKFKGSNPPGKKDFVQIITALRIFLPKVGINISTREESNFRKNLIGLGVTKMSAGVSTAVGGRTQKSKSKQFEISDKRTVEQMQKMVTGKGYQPVLKDWI